MSVLKRIKKIYKIYKAPKKEVQNEFSRLSKLPRYQKGMSNLYGFDMKFVDACTFLGGGEEILKKKVYQFKADNDAPFIIDCGANIGLSVLYFKRLYPNSEVIAFEPDQMIFNILKKNVKQNNCKNVKLYQKAIWVDNKGVEFNLEGGFSGRIPKSKEENNIVKVESQSLKDLINRPVDFLKIDIEGAENEVVFDIEEKLHFVKNIFIEFHSHVSEEQKLGEILTLLKKHNFRYSLHEAFVNKRPYVDRETMLGMDLQMNIYGFKKV